MTTDCPFCGDGHYSPDTAYFCMALKTVMGHYKPTDDEIKRLDELFPWGPTMSTATAHRIFGDVDGSASPR